MNDKELEERIKEIKNTNSNIPICVVREVKITDDSYLLKVLFNKKRKGNNEERIIKLKKSYFSKGNKLNGKTLTGKLYILLKIDKYSTNEDERNIKLFLILKSLGVVTKDNEIDIDKFKGLVFQIGKNNSTRNIDKNPNYILRYDYLFNCKSPSLVSYHTKKLFDGYKGYEKDYREFRKIDRKSIKAVKDVVLGEQKQKVFDVMNGFKCVIKEEYNKDNAYDKCLILVNDFLVVASRSKPEVRELSIKRLSKLFCTLIGRIDEQDRKIEEQNRKIEEQNRKIDEQDRRIKKLEKKLDRLENR